MDEKTHTGDDQEHHGAQRISQEPHLDAQWTRHHPIEQDDLGGPWIGDDIANHQQGEKQR
jgi:hypothetical protein